MRIPIRMLVESVMSRWIRKSRTSREWPGLSKLLGLVALNLVIMTGDVAGQARGIAIWKETATHPDGSAKVFEYESLESAGQVTIYTLPNGKEMRLTFFQSQYRIGYPNFMSRALTAPDQLGPIENEVKSYRDTIARYPATRPFLSRYVTEAEEIIRRVNAGEILFNGRWMNEAEHKALLLREEAIAKEANNRSNSRRIEEERSLRRAQMEKDLRKK